MKLESSEFIRRFLLHVLPDGFMKIRYFGYLSHRHKNRSNARVRYLMEPAKPGLPKKKECPGAHPVRHLLRPATA